MLSETDNSRSGEKAHRNCPEKFRSPPSSEFHCYFAASEGSCSVCCSQAVFSPSLSHLPLLCVPSSLSHFPVGCYCRVSSPSLIKSFVLRRGRERHAAPPHRRARHFLSSSVVQRKISRRIFRE